jgi:hypothetical protein
VALIPLVLEVAMRIVTRKKWTLKNVAKLAIIGIVSLAYFVLTLRTVGAWAGLLFVIVWIAVFVCAVFIYQRRRS